MTSIQEKKAFILDNEYQLANRMALQIIDKPQLSIWMIVIPIVFVYYFYGLHRFSAGKKEFVKQFVLSRSLILDAAFISIETGEKADFQNLAQYEKVPENAVETYFKWAKLLYEHYQKLLGVDGDSYQALVRARYREQGRFLLILNQINKAESQFYNALRKELKNSVSDVGEVIKKMENSLGHLRRDEVRSVFT